MLYELYETFIVCFRYVRALLYREMSAPAATRFIAYAPNFLFFYCARLRPYSMKIIHPPLSSPPDLQARIVASRSGTFPAASCFGNCAATRPPSTRSATAETAACWLLAASTPRYASGTFAKPPPPPQRPPHRSEYFVNLPSGGGE